MDEPNVKIRISPDVIFQPVLLGESLLLNVKTLTYFAFDALGTALWEAIQETENVAEAMQKAALVSGKPLNEIQPRMQSILAGLERSGLISMAES